MSRNLVCILGALGSGLALSGAAAQTRPARPVHAAAGISGTAVAQLPVPGAPTRVTAFIDVAVVPMDTERVLLHQTVLVRGGRIAALGPVTNIPVPRGAVRIDGKGQYLLPGFGACHGHIAFNGNFVWGGAEYAAGDLRHAELYLFLMFASGVTVLRNADYLNSNPEVLSSRERDRWGRWQATGWWLKEGDLLRLRAQAAAGKLWSPRIYTAGQWAPLQYVTQGQALPDVRLSTPRLDSVAAYVAAYKAAGYDFIKLHDETRQIAESVFAAARRVGIQVGGHVVEGTYDQVLAGGQRVADHGQGGRDVAGRTEAQHKLLLAADAGARRRAGLWSCDVGGQETAFIRALTDSGAGVLLGADGSPENYRLPFYVEKVGLTPYQALAIGTKDFGRYLRTLDPRGDETGTIAVGQRADVVLLTGNPLKDIHNAAFVSFAYDTSLATKTATRTGLMIGGRWMASAELNRRATVALLYPFLLIETEQMLKAGGVDSSLAPALRQRLMQLDSVHHVQRYALAERFVLTPMVPAGGADSLRGPEQLVTLFARQLGEIRAALPVAARDRFDEQARVWLSARSAGGYHLTIPGVRP